MSEPSAYDGEWVSWNAPFVSTATSAAPVGGGADQVDESPMLPLANTPYGPDPNHQGLDCQAGLQLLNPALLSNTGYVSTLRGSQTHLSWGTSTDANRYPASQRLITSENHPGCACGSRHNDGPLPTPVDSRHQAPGNSNDSDIAQARHQKRDPLGPSPGFDDAQLQAGGGTGPEVILQPEQVAMLSHWSRHLHDAIRRKFLELRSFPRSSRMSLPVLQESERLRRVTIRTSDIEIAQGYRVLEDFSNDVSMEWLIAAVLHWKAVPRIIKSALRVRGQEILVRWVQAPFQHAIELGHLVHGGLESNSIPSPKRNLRFISSFDRRNLSGHRWVMVEKDASFGENFVEPQDSHMFYPVKRSRRKGPEPQPGTFLPGLHSKATIKRKGDELGFEDPIVLDPQAEPLASSTSQPSRAHQRQPAGSSSSTMRSDNTTGHHRGVLSGPNETDEDSEPERPAFKPSPFTNTSSQESASLEPGPIPAQYRQHLLRLFQTMVRAGEEAIEALQREASDRE
ncbi:hypothetical protein F4780DRAFT_262678 [Xylariomycetidae sp. FL0641]|nr:hypothetical protein F4780DRAFT_262678 [Xylariomycetidae sp. FL0641]